MSYHIIRLHRNYSLVVHSENAMFVCFFVCFYNLKGHACAIRLCAQNCEMSRITKLKDIVCFYIQQSRKKVISL